MKQQLKIYKVKGNPLNPRLIKNDKFKKLVNSIISIPAFMKLRPIILDEDFMVIGGNMRLKAHHHLNRKEIWTDMFTQADCDEMNKIALAEERETKSYIEYCNEITIKDNVSAGEWEYDMLANEWDSVQLAEWSLDVWQNEDDKVTEGLIEDDEIPEVKESIVKRGDIWKLGNHKIMCGDSTSLDDVEKLMNGEKADMVFTDPPYGVEIKGKFTGTILNDNLKGNEFDDFLTACFNNLKLFNKGNLYISYEIKNHTTFENALIKSGFIFDEIIIWNKDSASFYSNNKYNRKFEPIFFIENGRELKCKPDVNVWDFAKSSSFASRDENNKRFNEKGNYLVAHPTTKPIGLITKPINNSTKENDLILDLFLGSGSTLIAAEKLNRKCYGMELDEKYCDVIINRWEQFTGLKATIINGTK